MPPCTAKKSDKSPCKGNAPEGDKFCAFHKRKHGGAITHGRTATAELLGIPRTSHATFDEFHERNKPFELTTELAYLRTLLVEQRKAMEAGRDGAREALFNDLEERSVGMLEQGGVKPVVIDKLMGALLPVWRDIIEGHYGPAEPLQPEQFQMLADMIEKTARCAEKAKKIQEGITLNVEFKNAGPILVRFVREVVFSEIHDPEVRQNIVARVRSMNLMGQVQKTSMLSEVLEHE